MSSYVPAPLRRAVADRAKHHCEYCLIAEELTFFGCHVEHIVSEKHGGTTTDDNLAYACAFCNRAKGTDLGSLSPSTGQLVRFYNPRTQSWPDHFRLDGAIIRALTETGEVTAKILGFNHHDRVTEREQLVARGLYPSGSLSTERH